MQQQQSETKKCAGFCGLLILILALIVLVVLYYVYAIIGLVRTSDKDVREVCEHSNLWIYVIVNMIIAPLSANGNKKDSDADSSTLMIMQPIIAVIFGILFIIWGGFEVMSPCVHDNLRNTILYKVALSIWIWNIIAVGLILSIMCGFIVLLKWKQEEETSQQAVPVEAARVPPLQIPLDKV